MNDLARAYLLLTLALRGLEELIATVELERGRRLHQPRASLSAVLNLLRHYERSTEGEQRLAIAHAQESVAQMYRYITLVRGAPAHPAP